MIFTIKILKKVIIPILIFTLTGVNVANAQDDIDPKIKKKLEKKYSLGYVKNNGMFMIMDKGSKKYGVANVNGKIIIKPSYTYLSEISNDGKMIAGSTKYTTLSDYGSSEAVGFGNLKIIDTNEKEFPSTQLNGCDIIARWGGMYNGERLSFIANQKNKIGLVNGSGKILIPIDYDYVGKVNEKGMGYLIKGNSYGYYNLSNGGEVVIMFTSPPRKERVYSDKTDFLGSRSRHSINWNFFDDKMIASNDGVKFGIYDVTKKEILIPYEYKLDIKRNYTLTKRGSDIITIYDYKLLTDDGVAFFDEESRDIYFKLSGIDDAFFFHKKDSIVWVPIYKNYLQNLYNLKTKKNILDDFKTKVIIIDEQIAYYIEDGKCHLFSVENQKLLNNYTYDDVTSIHENVLRGSPKVKTFNEYLRAKVNGKFGIIKFDGTHASEFVYNDIEQGIISDKKTNILKDHYLLKKRIKITQKRMDGGEDKRTQVFYDVLNGKTGEIIIKDANIVYFDGEKLIKMEKNYQEPIDDGWDWKRYYTAYSTDGKQLSQHRAYNYIPIGK